jgi:tetratricopeptide (TPR) repeat protein
MGNLGPRGAPFLLMIFVCTAGLLFGQKAADSGDYQALVKEGTAALAQNRLREAAQAFQRAVDLNPSSAKAHEGLGIALFRGISAGNVRPSADVDVAERAETHLKQAIDLSPSASEPRLQLSSLEMLLAERSPDADEKAAKYRSAQDLLKQVISLEPSRPGIYLRLANLERDEFGPPIQQAKARFPKNANPIPDVNLRHALQQQYAAIVDDAIAMAQRASETDGNAQGPLLLLSRLFRERALIRDTPEQSITDLNTASDLQRQFLAAGGHLDQETGTKH